MNAIRSPVCAVAWTAHGQAFAPELIWKDPSVTLLILVGISPKPRCHSCKIWSGLKRCNGPLPFRGMHPNVVFDISNKISMVAVFLSYPFIDAQSYVQIVYHIFHISTCLITVTPYTLFAVSGFFSSARRKKIGSWLYRMPRNHINHLYTKKESLVICNWKACSLSSWLGSVDRLTFTMRH